MTNSDPAWRSGLLIILLALICAPGVLVVVRGIADFSPPWWDHLAGTVLPYYAGNTLIVVLGATTVALIAGCVPAWLTFRYDFSARPFIVFLQLLPLTFPAYVSAGLYLEAFSSSFFESRAALAIELGVASAPFVFLFVRIGLARLPAAAIEAAAALGDGPVSRLRRVLLPLMAAPLTASVCLVAAEAISDFGAASRLGVATFTVGMHQQWFALHRPELATMLSMVLLLLAAALAIPIVRFGLRRQRANAASAVTMLAPRRPSGVGVIVICGVCLFIAIPGFWAPLALTLEWTAANLARTNLAFVFHDAGSTLLTAAFTVAVCLVFVTLFIFVLETGERVRRADRSVWLSVVNFVTPSLVFASIWLAAGVSGRGIIALAAAAKLLPLMLLPIADTLARMPSALVECARSLGCSRPAAVARVVAPQLLSALAGGVLLVFVLTATELTLSLTLQPFGYSALALKVYASAGLFETRAASVWAICLVIILLYPIWRLSRFVDAPGLQHA